ncbi:MAG: hypothetical protein E7218_05120 [Anaerofustis stercorihominis]|nr:hypothetical protein [Anaerofustis stercorihominis]
MKRNKKDNAFYELDTERIFSLVRELDENIDRASVERIIEECFGDETNEYDIENHPAVIQARKIIEQKRFDEDLRMIKREYPDENAQSVWELGDPFISLVMTGIVDALTAYEAYRAYRQRMGKALTPEIGGVNTGYGVVKEFYSPEEVDRLTAKDYEDPRVMKKVRNSMLRWKRTM